MYARKQRVALLLGYNGSSYYGLQRHYNHVKYPTVEHEIIQALGKVGRISPSNMAKSEKISWSRSSRTDKGVHGNGVVVCGKLLVGPELTLSTLPEELNELMPKHIKCFGSQKVSQSFNARNSQTSRKYEYILPYDILPGDSSLVKEMLAKFVGTSNYFNFTSPDHSKSAKPSNRKTLTNADTHKVIAGMDRVQQQYFNYRFDHEKARTVHSFESSVFEFNGRRMTRLTIVAESFLYHQIRFITGSLVAAYNGVTSPEVLEISLKSPFTLNFPLAPSQPLCLRYLPDTFYNWRTESDHLDTWNMEHTCHREMDLFHEAELLPVMCQGLEKVFEKWMSELKPWQHMTDADVALLNQRYAEFRSVPSDAYRAQALYDMWK